MRFGGLQHARGKKTANPPASREHQDAHVFPVALGPAADHNGRCGLDEDDAVGLALSDVDVRLRWDLSSSKTQGGQNTRIRQCRSASRRSHQTS
jgi:hypothetical protein